MGDFVDWVFGAADARTVVGIEVAFGKVGLPVSMAVGLFERYGLGIEVGGGMYEGPVYGGL